MHQQVRTSTTKSGAASRGGPGAAYDDGGSLVDILTILGEAGVNLQAAGGTDLDSGGDFVFSVHHGAEDDDGPGEEAASLLRKHGYDARPVPVHHCVVSDSSGSLLECIQQVEREKPFEIHVGTQGDYDGIPIQITTREALERKSAR